MSYILFYSWQSDLPNSTNRGFIEKALENTARAISSDETLEVEPVIDRDTSGIPGAPDIANTIFAKIEQSQVFVCDVSIINEISSPRPTPNPNVLIELGYAMKVLGAEKIVMIMNTTFGDPNLLPFDLRMRRVITYFMREENKDRVSERKKLQQKLEMAIRLILDNSSTSRQQSLEIGKNEVIDAISNLRPNATSKVRNIMQLLTSKLNSIAPDFSSEEESDELLINAIEHSKTIVIEFLQIAQMIAQMNALAEAIAFYKSFEGILEKYNNPVGFSGHYRQTDFDFYKFIGHELFTSFLSLLILENRWEIISNILEEGIIVRNTYRGSPDTVSFDYMAGTVQLFEYRNRRLDLRRKSVHADILNERHTEDDISNIVPMQQLMGADLFLYLRSSRWAPWSILYMTSPPRYLLEASHKKYAEQLLKPLGVETIEEFREQMAKRLDGLKSAFGVIWYSRFVDHINPNNIGSR